MYLKNIIKGIFVYLIIFSFPNYVIAKDIMLWKTKADYVAITPIEKGVRKNNHPVNLNNEEIYKILESIHIADKRSNILDLDLFDFITGEEKENNSEINPLFNKNELSKLSGPISKAFAKVSPNEDIIFSITGQHIGKIGDDSLSTAARIFYSNNNIHVIIGDMRVSLEKKYRRRGGTSDRSSAADEMKLNNFRLKTGSRLKETKLSTRLVTGKNHTLNIIKDKTRNDWMVVNASEIKNYITRDKTLQTKKEKLVEETGSLKIKSQDIEEKQEVLKRKVERLEKHLEAQKRKEKLENKKALDNHSSEKSLEERLSDLKKLYDKNLISEEIYNEKVKTLLSEL